jgi:hypothetical protein
MAKGRQTGKSRGSAAKSAPKASAPAPRVDRTVGEFTADQEASHQRVRDATTGIKPGPKPSGKKVRCRVVGGSARDVDGRFLTHGATGYFAEGVLPNRYLKPIE